MGIQNKESSENLMTCKKCGQIMEYYDAEYDLENKMVILKVKCDKHKGKRRVRLDDLMNLKDDGIINDVQLSYIYMNSKKMEEKEKYRKFDHLLSAINISLIVTLMVVSSIRGLTVGSIVIGAVLSLILILMIVESPPSRKGYYYQILLSVIILIGILSWLFVD